MKDHSLVWDSWAARAMEHPGREAIVHWDALSEPFRWTYGQLLEEAKAVAAVLVSRGVRTGDVCGLILGHHPYFYPVYMGVVGAGAVPAVLAYPNPRLHPEKFVQGLSGMARKSGLDWVLTERALEPVIGPLIFNTERRVKGALFPLEWADGERVRQPEPAAVLHNRARLNGLSPFLLQHSSGTTGLQKGVVISNRTLREHIRIYSAAAGLSEEDRIANWLPLYHDMGLIAFFLLPLCLGIPAVHIDPFQWVSAPHILFEAISRERCTVTGFPNFAYNFLASRLIDERMRGIDLSGVRLFVNAGEVVRTESHRRFLEKFAPYGVKKSSLSVMYGMAEATFCVTQTAPGVPVKECIADRELLQKGIVRAPEFAGGGRVCVSSGKPVAGCSVRVVDSLGSPLPEDRVGSIQVKSSCLFYGYRNDPGRTARSFSRGWYVTGDRGFMHEGECFVLGREDDLIVAAGNNVYPEDIEDAVNSVEGICPGRCAAFGVYDERSGTQDVCVIAETEREDEDEKWMLKLEIVKAAMAIDVTVSRVWLVPPRWLIKSSSGKISRAQNRERILAESWHEGGR